MTFGFMALVWVGAAVLTYLLLPKGRPTGPMARVVAALLVGQSVGFLLSLLLARATLVSVGPDVVIGLALAAWIALRPGIWAFAVTILFEALTLGGDLIVLTRSNALLPTLAFDIAWRAAIVAFAIVAIVERRRIARGATRL